jgi:galactan endo-1,6-beta-galactosidase
MPTFKQMRGFWLNWDSEDPASASFDWTADSNQRAMLLKAKSRGANLFEAFSNAPMWWMCYNHSTAGGAGDGDNLQSWNYDQFAKYLAIFAAQARDKWGIAFTSIEPSNEPSAGWWAYPGWQEGCHCDIATQTQVLGIASGSIIARPEDVARLQARGGGVSRIITLADAVAISRGIAGLNAILFS